MIIEKGPLTQITESLLLVDAPVSTIGCHRLKVAVFFDDPNAFI